MIQDQNFPHKLVGYSSVGMIKFLNEYESELVLRNLQVTFFCLLKRSRVRTKQKLIEIVIDISKEYYDKIDPVVGSSFVKWFDIFDFNEEDFFLTEEEDYVLIIDNLMRRVNYACAILFENEGKLTAKSNIDELPKEIIKNVSNSGFNILNNWFKQYILTIGIAIPIVVNLSKSKKIEIDFFRAINPSSLLFGLVRLLKNELNDFEKLLIIIEFGDLKFNESAKAFRDKILIDITGRCDIVELIGEIRHLFIHNYLINKDYSVIYNVIDNNKKYIFQNILKGFDSWSRASVFFSVEPGLSSDNRFNSYSIDAVSYQKNKWKQQYKEANDVEIIENLIDHIPTKEYLEDAITNNVVVLRKAIGVDVNEDTIRWLLINSTRKISLNSDEYVKHLVFKMIVRKYASYKETRALLKNIKSYACKSDDIFSYDGIRNRLALLARINALFDESIIGR